MRIKIINRAFLRKKRLGKKAIVGLIVFFLVILPTLILILSNAGSAEAAWYDDNFAYRQSIPVDTHSAAENNVYITISVDTAALTTDKLQADCDDLRFTKVNGEVLPYQIVSGCDSTTTSIRVGFDTMPAASFYFYMYYGNPSASIGSTTLTHSACSNTCTTGTFASEETAPSPIA